MDRRPLARDDRLLLMEVEVGPLAVFVALPYEGLGNPLPPLSQPGPDRALADLETLRDELPMEDGRVEPLLVRLAEDAFAPFVLLVELVEPFL